MYIRVYADGTVVEEDNFCEYDHATPYYDDYREFVIPDDTENVHELDITTFMEELVPSSDLCAIDKEDYYADSMETITYDNIEGPSYGVRG